MCQTFLIADETALPAALGILEQLAQRDNPPYVQAFFEVPEQGDCVNVEHLLMCSGCPEILKESISMVKG
ncbi:siderophore-interacting protein [Xenorhabdus bovienii]|uniref:SIP-like Rossmann fold domain-containing protein n=1 Tax=Xenorhabdus bovienii str. Intermedium TaxID=1379677 RepID=A0A077QEZ8_XENBV|nr:SIP domain-containing protein [Xenorhabdus bovienii]MDE9562903.1 siderophore-interacting protein [Xenorhabdus bovienii]CDH30831.1 hypothetical protein XBI1_110023 [Xenorhabdus bovienii str. Intermedium]